MLYTYSISNADDGGRGELGCIDLPDDHAARDFGDAVIADMLRDNADQYTSWTMNVTQGERTVWSIAFPFASRDRLRA